MWWGIGFGAFLYLVVLITLGIRTLKRGHGWMFFFGVFLPLFWLIGAFIGPTARAEAAYEGRRFVRRAQSGRETTTWPFPGATARR